MLIMIFMLIIKQYCLIVRMHFSLICWDLKVFVLMAGIAKLLVDDGNGLFAWWRMGKKLFLQITVLGKV